MLNLFSEQANKSIKDLFSLNAGAVEKFSQQQTELITGLISDHINYTSSLSKQRDYKEWVSVSQAYTESVRTRMLKSVNASYSMLTEANEEATKLLKKDTVTTPKATAKPAAKAAPKKAAPKPAAKAATKTTAKPAAKPAAKATPKAASSKTTSPKTATPAKTAEVAAEPVAAKAPAKAKAASAKPKTSTATRKTTATKAAE